MDRCGSGQLKEWVDEQIGPLPADPSSPLYSELTLIRDIMIEIHSAPLDPSAEPMLALDIAGLADGQ